MSASAAESALRTHEPAPTVRGRWRLSFPGTDPRLTPSMREEMVARALEIVSANHAPPFRRSRHAVTHLVTVGCSSPHGTLDIFIKTLARERGLGALKASIRGPRAPHVARMTQALSSAGFYAPPLLMLAVEDGGRGRGLVATARVEARALPDFLAACPPGAPAQKRLVMRALGAEIHRLHRAGFIHGDLTPFNVFVAAAEPPRFVFIDHERTRRVAFGPRQRLRNLVQLGRFDLKGLSLSDRMRVFAGYAAGLSRVRRRRLRRRVAAMIKKRLERDRVAARAAQRTQAAD